MRNHGFARQLVVCLFAVVTALGLPSGGHADTFTVNYPADLPDGNPGNGFCLASVGMYGVCTLRAAIDEANALAGADVIVVPEGTYVVGAELHVTEDVTIEGEGAWGTVITTESSPPDFLFRTSSNVYLILSDVTLRGAKTALFGFQSNLEISRVWFDGNTGRGVSLSDGTATILDSTFSGNSVSAASGGAGLGVLNGAIVSVTNSTFYGNSAGNGGAILVAGDFSSLDLRSSTLVDNVATDGSHSIHFDGAGSVHIDKTLFKGACNLEEPLAVTSNGGNAESPGNTCLIGAFGDQPNLPVAQLQLGSFGNYGGPVPTILPGTLSILVDPPFDVVGICTSTDARGLPRVGTCDVGATERQLGDPESGPLFSDGFESGDTSQWQ